MNDLIGEYQNTQVPPSIYEKNKSNNKEKIKFFEFLMYSTKSEIAISDLQNTLYWIGITECFVFLLGISLLISYAKQFWSFIFFIFHVLRAVVGFYWLITLPKTQKVIEDLSNYESLSIEEINQQIIKSYKGLVSASETKLRKIIIIYWGLTFLDMLIDLIIFFVLLADWGDIDYGAKNLISLVIIFILFSKFFISNNFSLQFLSCSVVLQTQQPIPR